MQNYYFLCVQIFVSINYPSGFIPKKQKRMTVLSHSFPILQNFCDPAGAQTQDLQNRNLTLYSAKLRGRAYEKRMQRYNIKLRIKN